jgi:hypothetical protein
MTPLEQSVVNIFDANTSIIDEIRFCWNGWTVSGIGRIGGLVRSGRVHVVLDQSAAGVNHYNTRRNLMRVFRDPTTPQGAVRNVAGEAGVIHEAVHALLDLQNFRGDDMDAEAMCYIAQADYHRRARSLNPDSGGYHRLGSQVANWLGGQGTRSDPPPAVPDSFRVQFFQVFSISDLYRPLVDQAATRNEGRIVSTRAHRYNGIPQQGR